MRQHSPQRSHASDSIDGRDWSAVINTVFFYLFSETALTISMKYAKARNRIASLLPQPILHQTSQLDQYDDDVFGFSYAVLWWITFSISRSEWAPLSAHTTGRHHITKRSLITTADCAHVFVYLLRTHIRNKHHAAKHPSVGNVYHITRRWIEFNCA